MNNSVISDAFRIEPNGIVAALLASFTAMLGLMPVAILPLFVGTLVDALGISGEMAGVVVSVNLLGNALGVLLVSVLLGALTLRQFVVLGVSLELVVEVLSLTMDLHLPGLLTMRLFAGIGGGLVTGAAFNWMAKRTAPDRGFGLLYAYQFFLSALLLYLLPQWITECGVSAFYGLFIVTALVSLCCCFVLTPTKAIVSGELESKLELDKKAIGLTMISIALFEIAASGIWAFIERMGLEWNFAPEHIGAALSIGALAGIPGALLVVLLGARWGRSKPIFCGVAFCVIGLAGLLTGFQTFWLYTLALLIFNGAWSFTIPYVQGVQAQLDPTGRVAVIGLFVVLLAIAAGPFIFGFLIGDQGYSAAIVFACLLLSGCLVFVFGVARAQEEFVPS
jgi:MFS family permease|tara:strand:- start:2093 stop:3271 length:1179 start_codon:yes stop_codon:yes gene_type:complete